MKKMNKSKLKVINVDSALVFEGFYECKYNDKQVTFKYEWTHQWEKPGCQIKLPLYEDMKVIQLAKKRWCIYFFDERIEACYKAEHLWQFKTSPIRILEDKLHTIGRYCDKDYEWSAILQASTIFKD